MELTGKEQKRLYDLHRLSYVLLSDYEELDTFDINLIKYQLVKFKVGKGVRITLKGKRTARRLAIMFQLDCELERNDTLCRNTRIYKLLKKLPTEQFPKYLSHESETVRFMTALALAERDKDL